MRQSVFDLTVERVRNHIIASDQSELLALIDAETAAARLALGFPIEPVREPI